MMPSSTPRTPGAGPSTWAAALLVPLLAGAAAPHGGQGPFAFAVTYTPDVHPGPISARVYGMLVEPGDRKEPRRSDDWFHPRPVLAVEVVPGKDHFGLIDRALAARFDREMREAVGPKDDAPSLPTR